MKKFILPILFPLIATAVEWTPEFQTLDVEELTAFDPYSYIGGEYQSDVLTFTKPFHWQYIWMSRRQAHDISTGSVSSLEFMLENRLKVQKMLNDWFELRFLLTSERTLERDNTAIFFELISWINRWIGIGVFGDPALEKKEDDLGFAIYFKPQKRHEIKLYFTMVDFSRNSRNHLQDHFTRRPYVFGLVGRYFGDPEKYDSNFLEYSLRKETPTTWVFPESGYEYEYWKWVATLSGSISLGNQNRLNSRIEFDRKFESKSNSTSLRTDRLITRVEWLSPFVLRPNWEFTLGVQNAFRRWELPGSTLHFEDLLPYFWIKMPTTEKGLSGDSLDVGYEFTAHHETNGSRNAVEHRLNLIYNFLFKDYGELRLVTTFDIDRIHTTERWEGGAMQFRLFF